jgi:hypothetical protein
MTVWEIFSLGDIPFPSDSWNEDYMEKIEAGIREAQPQLALPEVYVNIILGLVLQNYHCGLGSRSRIIISHITATRESLNAAKTA